MFPHLLLMQGWILPPETVTSMDLPPTTMTIFLMTLLFSVLSSTLSKPSWLPSSLLWPRRLQPVTTPSPVPRPLPTLAAQLLLPLKHLALTLLLALALTTTLQAALILHSTNPRPASLALMGLLDLPSLVVPGLTKSVHQVLLTPVFTPDLYLTTCSFVQITHLVAVCFQCWCHQICFTLLTRWTRPIHAICNSISTHLAWIKQTVWWKARLNCSALFRISSLGISNVSTLLTNTHAPWLRRQTSAKRPAQAQANPMSSGNVIFSITSGGTILWLNYNLWLKSSGTLPRFWLLTFQESALRSTHPAAPTPG